jgi:hypothetical protein
MLDLLSNLADWGRCQDSSEGKLVGAAALDMAWRDLDSENDLGRRICRRHVGVGCDVVARGCRLIIDCPSRVHVVMYLKQTSKGKNAAKRVYIKSVSR